jgi:hypothetical protein
LSEQIKSCRWCKYFFGAQSIKPCTYHNECVGFENFEPWYPTPEQFKEATGRDWPENWPVYYKYEGVTWQRGSYVKAFVNDNKGRLFVICAICPYSPPDDWRPE